MNAILYLLRTQIKNYIKQLIKRPAALVLYVIVIGFMIFSLLVSANADNVSVLSSSWLLGPLGAAVGALVLIYPIFKGISEGGTFFSMADVEMMFPSPVRPKRILIYGILNQMTTTLLIAFVLLFQTTNLRTWFGLSLKGSIIVITAVLILVYSINVVSMLVYAICSANPAWRSRFGAIGRVGTAGVATVVLYAFIQTGEAKAATAMLMSNPVIANFPVIGWTKSIFLAADTGGMQLLLPMAGIILFAVFVTVALTMVSTDFYEDVLGATEKRQAQRDEKRMGRNRDITFFKRGFKINMRGRGASAIFFRQLSEYARRGFFDGMTFALVISIVITRIALGSLADQMPGFIDRFILVMMAYMMMFFNMQGLWGKELLKPFIYMIPAKPFAKLVFAALLTPFKAFMDGVLVSVILIALTKMPIQNLLLYALTAAAFSAVYTAGDILSRVILGDSKTRLVTMFIYIVLSLILALPGGVFLFVISQLWLGCILCAAWCLAGAAIIIALCGKSALEYQAGAD